MTWTDRMYEALRERSRRLDPAANPRHVRRDPRLYDALEYLVMRRFLNRLGRMEGDGHAPRRASIPRRHRRRA